MTVKEGSTPEESAEHQGKDLPDREAMPPINSNLAAPIDASVALNDPNDEPDVDIDQTT